MTGNEAPRADPVGSVGEEAAKLLTALQDWARQEGTRDSARDPSDHRGPGSDAAGSPPPETESWLGRVHEHLATGGQDCLYCPVCQVIHRVRRTSPEVRLHLAAGVSSLLQAAAAVIQPPPPSGAAGRSGAGVERIDLDDDVAEED